MVPDLLDSDLYRFKNYNLLLVNSRRKRKHIRRLSWHITMTLQSTTLKPAKLRVWQQPSFSLCITWGENQHSGNGETKTSGCKATAECVLLKSKLIRLDTNPITTDWGHVEKVSSSRSCSKTEGGAYELHCSWSPNMHSSRQALYLHNIFLKKKLLWFKCCIFFLTRANLCFLKPKVWVYVHMCL